MNEAAGGDHYDVLIAGGGLVGASLAAALAPLPLRIAVIEACAPDSGTSPSYDDRATALGAGSERIFEGLGVWGAIAPDATPIHEIHVSERGRFGATRLSASQLGVGALGHVVENRNVGAVLWERLAHCDAVTPLAPARVVAADTNEDRVSLEVETGDCARRTLTGDLLAVTDGARSVVRTMLGIEASTSTYGQTAVIANVTPRRSHENVAYERFTDSGPLALLPMSNGRCNVVWTVWSDAAGEISSLDDAAFLARLQQAFGFRLGRFTKTGKRSAYPLSLVRAERQTGTRYALAGNASHGIHPVAGQGFNLGLRDVAVLAELIADSLAAGGDAGAPAVLSRYASWRGADQDRVVGFTDGLVRLFTNPLAPLGLARSAGLLALDLFTPAKEALAWQAMGLAGRVPRLARGLPLQ